MQSRDLAVVQSTVRNGRTRAAPRLRHTWRETIFVGCHHLQKFVGLGGFYVFHMPGTWPQYACGCTTAP